MKGWSARGTRPEFEVVTGVSTGALAAPFVFLGSDQDATLERIFTTYDDADLYSDRGLLGVAGSSLRDSAPLRRIVTLFRDGRAPSTRSRTTPARTQAARPDDQHRRPAPDDLGSHCHSG